MDIFTILLFPIHLCLLQLLSSMSHSSQCMDLLPPALVKSIPMHFLLSNAIINEIIFLISLIVCW